MGYEPNYDTNKPEIHYAQVFIGGRWQRADSTVVGYAPCGHALYADGTGPDCACWNYNGDYSDRKRPTRGR